jgi:hypothetical protein
MAPTEKEIGGRVWSTDVFGGKENWMLCRRIIALVGGPISEAFQGFTQHFDNDIGLGADGKVAVDPSALLGLVGGFVGLIGRVAEKTSDAEWIELTTRLLKSTVCKTGDRNVNAADALDSLFRGDTATLIQVLAWVVEVHIWPPLSSSIGLGVGLVTAARPATEG